MRYHSFWGISMLLCFKGGCKENKHHTLHRAINQHFVWDILGDLKTEQVYWSGEETEVGRQSSFI